MLDLVSIAVLISGIKQKTKKQNNSCFDVAELKETSVISSFKFSGSQNSPLSISMPIFSSVSSKMKILEFMPSQAREQIKEIHRIL